MMQSDIYNDSYIYNDRYIDNSVLLFTMMLGNIYNDSYIYNDWFILQWLKVIFTMAVIFTIMYSFCNDSVWYLQRQLYLQWCINIYNNAEWYLQWCSDSHSSVWIFTVM